MGGGVGELKTTCSLSPLVINLVLFSFFLISRQNLVSVIMKYGDEVEYLLQNEVFVPFFILEKY